LKLTAKSAQALTNLRGNRDFQAFLEDVKEYEAEQLQVCVSSEGVHLHRAQGAVKVLQNLQEWYADAPSILDKFKGK
jgi:endonuclease III-like uncharacterized protein